MEFFLNITEKGITRYRTPLQLTPTERVELIKQLCPGVDKIALEWVDSPLFGELGIAFTDYLTEHMEARYDSTK